jgi:hypothetical protein
MLRENHDDFEFVRATLGAHIKAVHSSSAVQPISDQAANPTHSHLDPTVEMSLNGIYS